MLAIKSNEMNFHKPQGQSEIRLNPNKAAKNLGKMYKSDKNNSKIAFVLTTGPTLLPAALEDMKPLDMFVARKFKKMFNLVGDFLQKNMAKQGFGTNSYNAILLNQMIKYGVNELIGGATIDLDLTPNYQFARDEVLIHGFTGTVISSNKLKFGHSWMFDRSHKTKQYEISEYLRRKGRGC